MATVGFSHAEAGDRAREVGEAKVMAELNREAAQSARRCRILGSVEHFSNKTRRALALRQRLRPDPDAHSELIFF